ncbi:hypothetical protein HKX48_003998 [Thoreauomyces humboldtii]|nr:hypothetical protein HKX48_003998 [Thoreauomyces humboldtii]
MSAPSPSERTTKKYIKKEATQLAIFARAENATLSTLVSSEPTSFLLLLNAGATGDVGGVAVTDLESAFSSFQGYLRVEMVLGRPYSYVLFEDATAAQRAREAVDLGNGIPTRSGGTKKLMMAWANKVSAEVAVMDPDEISRLIPGLFVVHELVSEACEKRISEVLSSSTDDISSPWTILNKRRVRHYGFRFDYELNTVDRDPSRLQPLPSWCAEPLAQYALRFPTIDPPDQLTVNDYMPGSGIAPHVDTHSAFTDAITSLTLSAGVVMEFRVPSADISHNVYLPPRSLCVMTGEARYRWEHGIRPRKTDVVGGRAVMRDRRVSLTFRTVKDPFDPNRALLRMSWNKYNLYSLATRLRPEDLSRKSVFQQKWTAKRELRAYHVPNITERQLIQRHWSARLPLQQLTQAEKDRLPPVQALAFAETERRLDVVVFRAHLASSLWMARASVVQGHVLVNGEKCEYPARRLEDGDMVTVSPSSVPTLRKPTVLTTTTTTATDATSTTTSSTTTPSTGRKVPLLDFKPVSYMAPWMFIPSYLEVDYSTCSVIFLRSPLPQPDHVEVPSPFPPEWHQLAYEWYSSIFKKKESIRTDPNLQPPVVVEGQTVKLKRKFAEIRRRDVKERGELRFKHREERKAREEKERQGQVEV